MPRLVVLAETGVTRCGGARRVAKLFAVRRGHAASWDSGVPLATKKKKRQFPSGLFSSFYFSLFSHSPAQDLWCVVSVRGCHLSTSSAPDPPLPPPPEKGGAQETPIDTRREENERQGTRKNAATPRRPRVRRESRQVCVRVCASTAIGTATSVARFRGGKDRCAQRQGGGQTGRSD